MGCDGTRPLARAVRRALAAGALLLACAPAAAAQMSGMPEMKEMMTWGKTLFVLAEQLEYSPAGERRPVKLDALAWYGGAYNRVWARVEGKQATTRRGGQGQAQSELFYGRLVDPYWDAVVGVRVDTEWGGAQRNRAQLAVGFLGLAPFRFEFEPTMYVSHRGELSGRLEASYQFLLTQWLVAEPEVELNAALQAVPRYDIASGLNDYEMAVRVRYEFRREIAPYVGVSRSRRVGGSRKLADEYGEPVAENRFVVGLRLWR